MRTFVISLLFAVASFGQTAPQPAAAPAVPNVAVTVPVPAATLAPAKITPEQRARFWRAVAELSAAQSQAAAAQTVVDTVTNELKATCKGQLVADEKREPSCATGVLTPAAPAPQPPPAAAKSAARK